MHLIIRGKWLIGPDKTNLALYNNAASLAKLKRRSYYCIKGA